MTRPLVLAYYFPNWHPDPAYQAWFGPGWTEWSLLRAAAPRFVGHRQPRTPLWGYQDESDPAVLETHVDLALTHGVDGFVFDYYWYEDGPVLDGALDRGYLAAANAGESTFALMWANHDLVDVYAAADPDRPRLLRSGRVSAEAFDRFARHVVDRYFCRENYLVVDERPWLSIYEVGSLVSGLGGVDATRRALDRLDAMARAVGFRGVHLDLVMWGFEVLPAAVTVRSPADVIQRLHASSASSYVWVHHTDAADHAFPCGDYGRLRRDAFAAYDSYAADLPVPFVPNVTVGWDSWPRVGAHVPLAAGSYPRFPVWPSDVAEFESALAEAAALASRTNPSAPLLLINAWNEWTEGSYLLPDVDLGTAHLEAVRRVLGPAAAARTGGV